MDVTLLLSQIAIVLVVSRGCARLLAPLRQPAVMAEMAAGLLLGPSLFGWLAPRAASAVFPATSLDVLGLVSQVGLVLYMFLVGWRVDTGELRKAGRAAAVICVTSIVVPFALGWAAATTALREYAPAGLPSTYFSLFMGAAMSVTAFPVLARLLAAHDLTHTRVGTLALACAAFDDVAGWLILAMISSLVTAGAMTSAPPMLVGLAAYLVGMRAVVRPLLSYCVARRSGKFGTTADDLTFVVLIALASAVTTDAMGLHPLFGAFIAGLTMPRATDRSAMADRMEPVTTVVLLPLFFAVSGMRTDLSVLASSPAALSDAALVLAIAVAGKGAASMAVSRVLGMPWGESATLGVLLNTRGLMELVILNAGLDLGVLSRDVFSMMVVMTFVTTCAAPPMVAWLSRIAAKAPRASLGGGASLDPDQVRQAFAMRDRLSRGIR